MTESYCPWSGGGDVLRSDDDGDDGGGGGGIYWRRNLACSITMTTTFVTANITCRWRLEMGMLVCGRGRYRRYCRLQTAVTTTGTIFMGHASWVTMIMGSSSASGSGSGTEGNDSGTGDATTRIGSDDHGSNGDNKGS